MLIRKSAAGVLRFWKVTVSHLCHVRHGHLHRVMMSSRHAMHVIYVM